MIGANIPLQEFIEWLASLGASHVIEFVTMNDVMVKTLLRNKEDQYYDYTPEVFSGYLEQLFNLRRVETLEFGTRLLFFAEPKMAPTGI